MLRAITAVNRLRLLVLADIKPNNPAMKKKNVLNALRAQAAASRTKSRKGWFVFHQPIKFSVVSCVHELLCGDSCAFIIIYIDTDIDIFPIFTIYRGIGSRNDDPKYEAKSDRFAKRLYPPANLRSPEHPRIVQSVSKP